MVLVSNKFHSKIFTFEQYLLKEDKSRYKHEYFQGDIIRMAGAKFNHNLVATNMSSALNVAVKVLNTKYLVCNSDQKIFIEQYDVCLYADAIVICERPVFWNNRQDIIINPMIVVEILSKSTSRFDKGDKFLYYQSLLSFKEYIIIDPTRPLVEAIYREEKDLWRTSEVKSLENTLLVRSLGVEIPLHDIYDNIEFTTK